MSCEVITYGGSPMFLCGETVLCNQCGLPSLDSPCGVCALLRVHREEALRLARELKYSIGPFCQFCESLEETVLCDWPEMKPTPKRTELAEIGDVWITEKAGKRGRITEVNNLNAAGMPTDDVFVRREIWVLIPGHPKPYPYSRVNGMSFTTLAPGTCDRQCCWRHQREVGENRHYCKAHWDSWQGGMAA